MKISKVFIKGFQQFQDVELDFTNPETGLPLNKICFIGSNGTGKSVLLNEIKNVIRQITENDFNFNTLFSTLQPLTIFEFFTDNKFFYYIFSEYQADDYSFFSDERVIDISTLEGIKTVEDISIFLTNTKNKLNANHTERIRKLLNKKKFLLINSPAESVSNSSLLVADVPKTSVNEALSLNQNFPNYNEVSSEKINEFWKLLVYNLRKRAEDRDNYENLQENLTKTKQQLIAAFDLMEPKVLTHLNLLWKKILDKAGLYFDVDGASNPYQLLDNLKAYIRLKSNNQHIPYNQLSTGIRNYIFRIGHIFSLYFNREIDLGFLLVDEPENSLYPDFLFELVETYQEIIIDKRGQNNTQLFFATHNPIIAAQFQPYERIILDWNEDGFVSVRKGVSPVGDDPNDVLTNDFELTDLMGAEGREQWKKYVALKTTLANTKDKENRFKLASEINKLGTLYNFEV